MTQIVNPREQIVDPVEHPKEVNWKIGTVVTLNTHPFTSSQTSILISGDTSHLPPLMVIIERQENFRKLYDEHNGMRIDDFQVKCIYYSNKDQFEEIWLSSKLLKSIGLTSDTVIEEMSKCDDILKINETLSRKLVSLKTMEIELGKKKSSFRNDSASIEAKNTRVEALLNFLSPVMQIIEVKKYDQKEAPYDPKFGRLKKTTPKWVAKCRWFSNDTNKFIEKFLPIESLAIIKSVTESLLTTLQNYTAPKKYLRLKRNNEIVSIIDPKFISCRNGLYFLNYFDLISNSVKDEKIVDESAFEISEEPIIRRVYPDFDLQEDTIISKQGFTNEMSDGLRSVATEKFYIRIKYKNANEQVSERTISNYVVKNIPEQEGQASVHIPYLIGYCNLRQEQRTFRIERIQRIEVLDLKYT